jgi:hypothetical protein
MRCGVAGMSQLEMMAFVSKVMIFDKGTSTTKCQTAPVNLTAPVFF